jgi:CBS domain-containing protein
MAFVGPVISLLIGVLSFGAWALTRDSTAPIRTIFAYLAVTNILLGIFNLLPGFPLDGGRVLRSIVWKISGNAMTATNVATATGQIIAYLFILLGILLFFRGNPFNGIWLGFIGWFLLTAAQSARTQATLDTMFRGVSVGQAMNKNVVTVPANISLQKLVDEYFIPEALRSAFVMQGSQLAGLITLSDIRHVPRAQWSQTPVGSVMIPAERLHTATPQQSLRDVLTLMNSQDINQLPVVENGQLVGVLRRDGLLRSLEVRRSLNVKQAA